MSTEQIATQYSPEYLEEYNGYGLYVLTITFIIVETLCVSLRFYSRKLGNVPWGADDTLIIPGAILCLAICACCLAHLQTGALGHHEAAVIAKDPYQLVIWARYVLVFPLVYSGAVLFTKLAILAIYLRIFTSSFYRTATWVLVGLLIANWVALTVATCLMCIPLNYLWDRTIPGGHCINIDAFYCWSGLFNVVTDIAMLVLPLPVIWKLNTSRNIKVGLTILFATGSV
ncbi:MAG: hypothetical protein LQ342_005102 [Letrouitia transgressa]|nr:MAG: hypothetical protein LQ342_005102 [Letrouitia transgressa]